MIGRRTSGARGGGVALLALGVALVATGCDRGPEAGLSRADEVRARLVEADVDDDERIRRIAAEARPGNLAAVLPLARVMKDRSHAAFLMASDDATASGYRAVEFKGDPEFDPIVRTAAVCALERIGSHLALPDLLLALDDRSPWVANHAARALLRLGYRAGIPVLLANLEENAAANETANRILEQVTGRDFGFSPDIGHVGKREARERWLAWWEELRASGGRLDFRGKPYVFGQDAETDRRIRFMVELLGQFQFMYHNQARKVLQRMGPSAIPFLVQGVERARRAGVPQARAAVAQVLVEIDHPKSRDLLFDLLEDGHPTVRSRAASSLGELGGRDVVEGLARRLDDPEPAVQLAILGALGRLGGPAALDAVTAFDPGGSPEAARARVLARFTASRGREERDEVLELLVEGGVVERNEAHEALVAVTGTDAGYDSVAPQDARLRSAALYREILPP